MKEKICSMCKTKDNGFMVKVGKKFLCRTCFNFMFDKYRTIEKIEKVLEEHHENW